ncbi:MAG: YggU family protein [Chloroflexi bacterium]|nr:YggU family protein [Chloroflexota bacterium]MBI3733499.1 YggU family protein [Chloroflexota bacterium]
MASTHPPRKPASGVVFNVKVTPRASNNQLEGWHGDALKVRLQAPPVDGKANAALIALLARALNVNQQQIQIISGETSRHKRVRVQGLSADQLRMGLEALTLEV